MSARPPSLRAPGASPRGRPAGLLIARAAARRFLLPRGNWMRAFPGHCKAAQAARGTVSSRTLASPCLAACPPALPARNVSLNPWLSPSSFVQTPHNSATMASEKDHMSVVICGHVDSGALAPHFAHTLPTRGAARLDPRAARPLSRVHGPFGRAVVVFLLRRPRARAHLIHAAPRRPVWNARRLLAPLCCQSSR